MEICGAKCSDVVEKKYFATGQQKWSQKCSADGFVMKDCRIPCEITHKLPTSSQSTQNSDARNDNLGSESKAQITPLDLQISTYSLDYSTIIMYSIVATVVIMLSLLYRCTRKAHTSRRSNSNSNYGGRYRRMT